MLDLFVYAAAASAHEGGGLAGEVYSGFIHPFTGWDHVIAILALGMWGAMAGNPAVRIAAVLAGAFAVFHGYVHGVALPGMVSTVMYCAGFVMATGLLFICGSVIGLFVRSSAGLLCKRVWR